MSEVKLAEMSAPHWEMKQMDATTKHNLDEQGFAALGFAAESSLSWPLRFTPGVSITLIAIGLALRSPIWLGAMALVAMCGALLPRGMPIDLFYNLGVRHVFHAPPLPPTPKPRRFSYGISTVFLGGSALAFYDGRPVVGVVLGGGVVVWGAVLTTTLWCLGSWIYKLVFRTGSGAL